jgi:SAM-dependent methyltransferase
MKLKKMLWQRLHRDQIYKQPEYWNGKAEEYRGMAVSMWPNNWLNQLYHQAQLHLIHVFLPNLAGKKVLELGCGTGRIARALAEKGAHVIGIDFSPKAIEIAKQNAIGPWPQYRLQSIFDLEEDSYFEAILSVSCLATACSNTEELLKVLERSNRAMISGGQLLLIEPFHRGFLHRVLNASIKEILPIIKASGFHIEHVHHLAFWPTRLLLAYFPFPKWFTVHIYHIGEWILRIIFRNYMFGDYIAISGRKPER